MQIDVLLLLNETPQLQRDINHVPYLSLWPQMTSSKFSQAVERYIGILHSDHGVFNAQGGSTETPENVPV